MIIDILTILLIFVSWVFLVFGMVSIFILKNLYTRILSAATIDTVAALTLIIALMVVSYDRLDYMIRFILLIAFLMLTTPISSHVNIRSAYLTGLDVKRLFTKKELAALEREAERYE